MDILRTPDDRFTALPGYPFAPHYLLVQDRFADQELRIHYVDEGPEDGPPVLMLHGEPSWSYLYRHMIPMFVDAGYRAVAPDLVGFGKSDKPVRRDDYSYARHLAWLQDWLRALDLRNITLICQDWGGLLGLRLLADEPERFARVITSNTLLPTGDEKASNAFLRWRDFSQRTPQFEAGFVVNTGCTTDLSADVIAAYNAPFPNEDYLAGARQFPVLVPVSPDDPESSANRDAWSVLSRLETPWLCAFGDSDPVTAGVDAVFRRRIPGCVGQPHTVIAGGGHFIQEDRGPELGAVILDWLAELDLAGS